MLEAPCYKISNSLLSSGISGPLVKLKFMLLFSQGRSKDEKIHTFLLIICKMLQLISAGTYILKQKAFKHNVETKSLGEGDAGVKVPVTKQIKWVFIFMVVSHLKDFFFLFFNIYLNSSACMDEYIFIKQIIKAGTRDAK